MRAVPRHPPAPVVARACNLSTGGGLIDIKYLSYLSQFLLCRIRGKDLTTLAPASAHRSKRRHAAHYRNLARGCPTRRANSHNVESYHRAPGRAI